MATTSQVRAAVEKIRARDKRLGEELQEKREQVSRAGDEELPRFLPTVAPVTPAVADGEFTVETIVLRTGRPVLRVLQNQAELTFEDAESEVWRDRLIRAREPIGRAILASGRIELENHRLDWVGTGWLVRPDVIVTNRHVAEVFARRQGDRFVFRTGLRNRQISASIDFLEEFERSASLSFRLREIISIVPDGGPDIAFLRVDPGRGSSLANPLDLDTSVAPADRFVATIGYPARDSRIPEQDLMERIFGNVFDKKRLAPGQITDGNATVLEHDCSTLGGNSGSVVLDLETGKAAGLHFAGRFLEANFAVPASAVAKHLDRALRGSAPRNPDSPSGGAVRSVTYTIPIRVTVEIGSPGGGEPPPPPEPPDIDEDEDDEPFEPEARPEEYLDREGYDPKFLGSGLRVPLPRIERDRSEIVSFEFDGKTETELRYQHFSVMMNRKRRLCFFSAVNIDGGQPRNGKRPGWRLDPRIPSGLQIQKECYGNPPKFSRGHMTRRQDPVWGSKSAAARGNSDSMHVTNAVPQMQIFNGGIWLGLEDYALENCREDDMRICVFTGPVFRNNDPIRFGVKIPRIFWKVIAFIHDGTGQLSATGYSMSQDRFLEEREFVFGPHETFQRSLKWIEDRAGVSFGTLADRDLFETAEEAPSEPLTDFRKIRFF